MSESREPRRLESVSNRLKRRLDRDLDPGISLEPEEAGAEPISSAIVERFARSGLARTRYELKGEVARGGMGAILSVWDADLRRTLAMKVVLDRQREESVAPVEAVDPGVLSRFLEEAQVTGQLDHPGVVPVHELGLDEAGHAFFTMRLVRGQDLGQIYHEVRGGGSEWSVTRALGVLLKVSEAMAYAHSKGVIHRDLKPANVMVGRFGEAYVMDWGLARVEGSKDRVEMRAAGVGAPGTAEDTDALRTQHGDVLGTPAYMSPEQAAGRVDAVDKRTDVYAMGAMLYHLLGGKTPYAEHGPSTLDVLSAVREGPPKKLVELAPDQPAELVAICEKAMSRERDERYPDMQALGEDLRAYLENRVVRAHQTGAVAEFRKWVQRNRGMAVALASIVFLLLASSTAIAAIQGQNAKAQAENARRERDLAEQLAAEKEEALAARDAEAEAKALAEERRQEAEAREREAVAARDAEAKAKILAEERRVEAEAREAEALRLRASADLVAGFMVRLFESTQADVAQGREITARDMLDEGAARLAAELSSEPLVQARLGFALGSAYLDLGHLDRALAMLEPAYHTRRELLGEDAVETLDTRYQLGRVTLEQGRHAEAEESMRATLAGYHRLFGPDHRETLRATSNFAVSLATMGKLVESEALFRELLARRGRGSAEEELVRAQSLGDYAGILVRSAEFDRAEAAMHEALEVLRLHYGPMHPDVLASLNTLGGIYHGQGRWREAEEVFEKCLETATTLYGEDHPRTITVGNNLGAVYLRQGRIDEAAPLMDAALEWRREELGSEHPLTLQAMFNLGTVRYDQGRFDECEALYLEVLEKNRAVLGEGHPQSIQSLASLYGFYLAHGTDEEIAHHAAELERLVPVGHPARRSVEQLLSREKAGD